MTINIKTGKLQNLTTQAPAHLGNVPVARVTEYDDTTPAEMVVFPREGRALLRVEPGVMFVVTGYNLRGETKVVFNKVLRSAGFPALGDSNCCPHITVAKAVKLHEVRIPCWIIDECNPIFVLYTPGLYEVDVEGQAAEVVVTAVASPLQPVNAFGDCRCRGGKGQG